MNGQAANDLERLRERKPLVHSITNFVVMNETANALLCIGALPIMAHAVEEVEEMVDAVDALVLNIGTLTPEWVDAMIVAGRRANELDKPVVLDPVGAGATALRTESCRRILDEVRVSIVRGNAAEISILAGLSGAIRGVESVGHQGDVAKVASSLAELRGCTVALTGAIDAVSDGNRVARISNGTPLLARVTGTGCMSSTIAAAFAAVQPDMFTAATSALATFGIAGEMAEAAAGGGPGSFHVALYDALAAVSSHELGTMSKVEVDQNEAKNFI